jgi:hypothetical protein
MNGHIVVSKERHRLRSKASDWIFNRRSAGVCAKETWLASEAEPIFL